MVDLWIIFAAMGASVIMIISGVLLGAWIMFKGKSNTNGSFIGKEKGEVFSIQDADDLADFPGAEEPNKNEKRILKKTESFLKSLGG